MNDSVTALILKQTDYREADAILTVLTAEYGKLSFIAGGVRKMASKNAGSVLPFTEAQFQYDHKQGRTMFRLKTARTVQLFRKLHEDLNLSAAAGMVCEIADLFCMQEEAEAAEEQYDLTRQALTLLNEGKDPGTVLFLYASDMMGLFGIAADVDECVRCFSTTVSAVSAAEGGFLCADCASLLNVPLSSAERLRRFRLAVKAGLKQIRYVEEAGGTGIEDLEILMEMIRLHTGMQIRSFSFFKRILSIE